MRSVSYILLRLSRWFENTGNEGRHFLDSFIPDTALSIQLFCGREQTGLSHYTVFRNQYVPATSVCCLLSQLVALLLNLYIRRPAAELPFTKLSLLATSLLIIYIPAAPFPVARCPALYLKATSNFVAKRCFLRVQPMISHPRGFRDISTIASFSQRHHARQSDRDQQLKDRLST